MDEVLVRGQKRKVMTNAKLGEQGIDRPDLNTGPATRRAQGGGIDVVLSIRLHERQGCKAVDDLRPRLGTGKALQQFLENEARRHDGLRPEQSLLESDDLRLRGDHVPPKCQRPDARVDQKHHPRRVRSAL